MAEQLQLNLNPPDRDLPQLWTPDDIYRTCDQRTVELFKEDGRVERKRAEVNVRDLGDYLSMWANTQPAGGLIFIGVANNGEINGCKHIEQDHLNDIEGVRRFCSDARIETKRIAVTNRKGDSDFVIAMRVHYRPDKLVETSDGNAFVREGDEKRKLTETEKREIRLNKGEIDCELEPVSLKYPSDFSMPLLEEFRRQYLSKRNLPPRYEITDILHLAKLGSWSGKEFRPNLACALLFAKDPRAVVPGACIRIIRYDGVEEQFGRQLNTVADHLVEGPLPIQIQEAEKFILTQMRNFTRLGADGRFSTRPEYPREVWLEAVVNAVVHRSYNLRHMNIFVKMFEDKIVVDSPGAFMPPTTAATVYDTHNPRNPHLMWGLYYFDYVQCAFEGTRRMREGMRAASLPDPVFVQKTSGIYQVSVTLQNAVEHRKSFLRADVQEIVTPAIYEGLSEDEKMVINFLADRGALNVTETGLLIQGSWRTAKALLDGLEAKKLLDRTPGKERDNSRRYFIRGIVKGAIRRN